MTDSAPSLAPRSALYMPASNPRALAKGPALDADAVIIDLEDAVAPSAKARAREAAVEALQQLDYGQRQRVLRVNAESSSWHDADIEAAAAARPDAVLLPKVDHGDALARFSQRLDAAGLCRHVRVWAMLESPAAVIALGSLAEAGRELSRFTTVCVGNNDLSLAAGMAVPAPRDLLQVWLQMFVAAARAGGLAILDGVYNDYRDLDGLRADSEQSAAIGMDGRTLIHPAQIACANAVYSPDAAAIAEAEKIVAAFADPTHVNEGVIAVDGVMYEALHHRRALQTLALAARNQDA